MMKNKVLLLVLIILTTAYLLSTKTNLNFERSSGDIIDSYNNIDVYYNGGVNQTFGRNKSSDGYNIGIKYQCVEFIKRYYFMRFSHKMPDSYGHAKDFYDSTLLDGELNKKRNLIQYKNGSSRKPKVEDIIIFSPWLFNQYGHIAIISKIEGNKLEIIQQNPGPFGSTRESFALSFTEKQWKIEHERILGWLHLEK